MIPLYVFTLFSIIITFGYACYFFGKKRLVKNKLFNEYLVTNSVIKLVDTTFAKQNLPYMGYQILFNKRNSLVKELMNEVNMQDKTYYGFNILDGIECDNAFNTLENFGKVIQQYDDLKFTGKEAIEIRNGLIAKLRELNINSILED